MDHNFGVIMMPIKDHPLSDEIRETQKAIEDLKKTNDIGALQLAESDLNYLLEQRAMCNDKDEMR